jgi:hypothetical protein
MAYFDNGCPVRLGVHHDRAFSFRISGEDKGFWDRDQNYDK